MFQLAIAEAERVPEIRRTLDSTGRAAARRGLAVMLAQAQSHGLLNGDPVELAALFLALLWGDLMTGLLLGLAEPPTVE